MAKVQTVIRGEGNVVPQQTVFCPYCGRIIELSLSRVRWFRAATLQFETVSEADCPFCRRHIAEGTVLTLVDNGFSDFGVVDKLFI